MPKKIRNMTIFILLLALFTVLGTDHIYRLCTYQHYQKMTITSQEFRDSFYSDKMHEIEEYLSNECRTFQQNVENEVSYFPIPESTVDKSLDISFVDTWMSERTYQGKRGHEGTDIMASENMRGLYPVVSVSDGTVTNIGWLEKGGYRIGITSHSGTYYYYAHLDSYANVEKGDKVVAGELLGFMGDSGYGPEGTTGQFAVHLHFGIYYQEGGKEISVNPYYVLLSLKNKKLKYSYS